ncbi:Uncharacterised protein [Vibrio cholerae]|nr:Uncharacterised protein [Vibrio cholerae]
MHRQPQGRSPEPSPAASLGSKRSPSSASPSQHQSVKAG